MFIVLRFITLVIMSTLFLAGVSIADDQYRPTPLRLDVVQQAAPDDTVGQRFTASTPSTLETVTVYLYEAGSVGTSDDGTCADLRGSVRRSGVWMLVRDAYGFDASFLMEVELCDCCELRGDFDHSGQVDIADLVYRVTWSFNGGPAPVPCP